MRKKTPIWYINGQVPVYQSQETLWQSEARSEVITFKGSNLFEIHLDGIGPYGLDLSGAYVPQRYHDTLLTLRNTQVTIRRMRDGSQWSAVLTNYEASNMNAEHLYRADRFDLVRVA